MLDLHTRPEAIRARHLTKVTKEAEDMVWFWKDSRRS